MGGVDKGLVTLDGRPMVAHVLARLAPQVGALIINANQNLDRYAAFGHPVVPDEVGGFAGPLAGLHAGMTRAATPYVATAPCDSPFLPGDLVVRLAAGHGARRRATRRRADVRTAASGVRAGRLCGVLPHLAAFLRDGGRKIDAWYATLRSSPCRSTTRRRVSQHQYSRRAGGCGTAAARAP